MSSSVHSFYISSLILLLSSLFFQILVPSLDHHLNCNHTHLWSWIDEASFYEFTRLESGLYSPYIRLSGCHISFNRGQPLEGMSSWCSVQLGLVRINGIWLFLHLLLYLIAFLLAFSYFSCLSE